MWRLFGVVASLAIVIAGSTASAARFPLPLPVPVGNPQDVAVKAALSEFGKSIGDQLPIVVSPADAFPTGDLPGGPFAARSAPNVTSSLRASSDGTVMLPPGDYAFTVEVFCMKASAHSPSAHRYLVAPLQGSAADVFRALNSRAPTYRPDHFALQVLSWDIQAGLAYGEMRAPQQALVDRLIPDLKSRLQSDLLTRIESQYDQTAARVPGMPSFDGALSQIGPAGQAIIELQALHQQMMQPPPTFAQLAQELVPFAPLEPGGSGPTPWSRYSDRVYVRFVTSGNYATPGTYQIRVLPAPAVSFLNSARLGLSPAYGFGSGLGPFAIVGAALIDDAMTLAAGGGAGAPAPFSNVVNNPGTPSVQPLTQFPQPGNPGPSPSPTPRGSITSQTVATHPSDRSRLTVGVGEQVKLTFSGSSADWSISGGEGTVTPTGKTSIYTASITPATETIEAVDPVTHAEASITFDVIAPSGLLFERVKGTDVHHHKGWPDIGFSAKVYLQPDTVSFENIGVREQDATYSATGYYAWMDGQSHNPQKEPELVTSLVTGKGWLLSQDDDVWSGREPATPPFAPGHETVDIPWEYDAAADGDAGPFHLFAHVTQVCELKNDRSTIVATKGAATLTLSVSSPDYR